jgi:hypothetical protein
VKPLNHLLALEGPGVGLEATKIELFYKQIVNILVHVRRKILALI